MSNIAIQLTEISKKFNISSEKASFQGSSFINKFVDRFRVRTQKEFWALQNISFEVNEGESVGIIGMNGAGKTTLLKILSDIIRPTSGTVRIRGQLAAILEIGVGFHQELSGRENIYLYGKMLGFSSVQIKSKFDEIVEFSEITDFIDTPIKHYSSGMLMRLGFAIIASLETDIILLDEMLAVGDIHFRSKCLNKIIEMKNQKRTIVMVGHDMNLITNYCDKFFLLDKGQLIDSGSPKTIIDKYYNILLQHKPLYNDGKWNENRTSNEKFYKENLNKLKLCVNFDDNHLQAKSPSFRLISVQINYPQEKLKMNKSEFSINKEIEVLICAEYYLGKSDFGFVISDMMNNRLFGEAIFKDGKNYPFAPGIYTFSWVIPPNIFNEGVYKLGIIMTDEQLEPVFSNMELLIFVTVDQENPMDDFALYLPLKPKIEFSYKSYI